MKAPCCANIKKKKINVRSAPGHSANGNGWKGCKELCISSKKNSEAETLTERPFALADLVSLVLSLPPTTTNEQWFPKRQ